MTSLLELINYFILKICCFPSVPIGNVVLHNIFHVVNAEVI